MRAPWNRLTLVMVLSLACLRTQASQPTRDAGPTRQTNVDRSEVVEWVYDGKLKDGWSDYGYCPHGKSNKGPQELNLSKRSGWILAKKKLDWEPLGSLTFRYKTTEDFGDFLDVKLTLGDEKKLPKVAITSAHRRTVEGGFQEVVVPMEELNPDQVPFDRIRFQARKDISSDWVLFDRLGFLRAGPRTKKPPPPPVAASLRVDCQAKGHPISRLIYGTASSHKLRDDYGEFQVSTARWGGNTSSRFNWELGNAWNAGSDWFFMNTNYSRRSDFSWRDELAHNTKHGVTTALSVPMLSWVAKDTRSYGFPVSEFGKQAETEGDMGNGVAKDGKTLLQPGPPTRTSVPSTPESIGRWVKAVRELDQKLGKRTVAMYILDNEPGLWHETHRDVHPEPATYDELLEKSIAYATAIRAADPEALIAGPAEWGWSGYFYSAADVATGVRLRPDRRAHGDEPLLPWYLRKLAEHEKKTGTKLLDVLDVHYYPQAKGIGLMDKGKTDPATAALRIRTTRSLWDPTYKDESWIDEPVELIPRLKQWVAAHYPRLKVSLGEYNFGAEGHMSGGLALAEALGRFGQQDLYAAYYWRFPEAGTPAWAAMRAFGNYDGKGARFPDWHVPARASENLSVFAARDEKGERLVLIALNFDPARPAQASVEYSGCGSLEATRVFRFTEKAKDFEPGEPPATAPASLELPAYSITVVELTRTAERK